VPVSALRGDNVCRRSDATPWYGGGTLFELLEGLDASTVPGTAFRMPVQWVTRGRDFRGLAGTLVSGRIKTGDAVLAQPSGKSGTVRRIAAFDGDLDSAHTEDAVCLQLAEDLDISRGEVLVAPAAPLEVADQLAAKIVWLGEDAMQPGRGYVFRQGATEAQATVTELSFALDLDTMKEKPAKTMQANDIGRIKLALDRPLPFCAFAENKVLGAFLLVDRISGNTVGAGLIEYALRRSHNLFPHKFTLNKDAHAGQKNQTARVLWFTGLSASGKSTVADLTARTLHAEGKHVYILDGDGLRLGLNKDLGFTEADRAENIRRASEVARVLVDAGLIVLATFISPYRSDRLAIRERFAPGEFSEIFVDTPLELCIARDPKGLYKKALSGRLPNFTGVSAPFEAPENPDLRLDGARPPDDLVREVVAYWKKLG
jgi:bifunctional enzyme CysN/CysC